MKKIVLWGLLSISFLGRAAEPEIRVLPEDTKAPLEVPSGSRFRITVTNTPEGRSSYVIGSNPHLISCDFAKLLSFSRLVSPQEDLYAFYSAMVFSVFNDDSLIPNRRVICEDNLKIAQQIAPETLKEFDGYIQNVFKIGFEEGLDIKNQNIQTLKAEHAREIQELRDQHQIDLKKAKEEGLLAAQTENGFVRLIKGDPEFDHPKGMDEIMSIHRWLPSKKDLGQLLQARSIIDAGLTVTEEALGNNKKKINRNFALTCDDAELVLFLVKQTKPSLGIAPVLQEYYQLNVPSIGDSEEMSQKYQEVLKLYNIITTEYTQLRPLCLFEALARNTIARNGNCSAVYAEMLINLLPSAKEGLKSLTQNILAAGGGAGKSDEVVAAADDDDVSSRVPESSNSTVHSDTDDDSIGMD